VSDCIKCKDPNSILDFGFDWTDWLNGDILNGSIWIVPEGLTKVSDNYTNILGIIWLSGGTIGKVYKVINRITTIGGRTEDRTLVIKMRNR